MKPLDKSSLPSRTSVLITGAAGYIGKLFTEALANDRRGFQTIVAADVRPIPASQRLPGIQYVTLDIRSPEAADILRTYKVDTVIHLASVVSVNKDHTREFLYDVEVGGTRNLLEISATVGVRKFIVTSSGAAYGYYPDNAPLLTEDCPLRGNESIPYAWHKRLVEEILREFRTLHPQMAQLVFRPCTILGEAVSNQITAMFERPVVVGIKGFPTFFVFIWDQDVVRCLLQGVHGEGAGTFNLAADGMMTLAEIAARLRKPYAPVPEGAFTQALSWLNWAGLTSLTPTLLDFIKYRPVLGNERLKTEFGFHPEKTSREVFDLYAGRN